MMKRQILLFLLLAFSSQFFQAPCLANNVRSQSVVEVVEVMGDTALLQFDLQWDNSWRDAYNWDAAWIFLKYKIAGGEWLPVYLGEGGHTFTDDYTCMAGKSGANVIGLYVYRSQMEAGAASTTCRLKWKLPAGLTQEQFKTNRTFIMAQAVEMVLIPYGAYYLGDGASAKSFVDANGNSVLIDSEAAQGLRVKEEATAINLIAAYPKGYKGFYLMKYELSQEQYVAFLNTLTFAQQAERVPGLTTMKQGDYIFGDRTKPNNRNGIIVNVPSTGTTPALFANNLNNDTKYNQPDDGKTIACNYMTPEDLHTYCSWSGLRPMSELEYEKASRTPYPETPKAGEYAWNDNATPVKAPAITNGGAISERPASGVVNAGSLLEGPVRSGSFAKSGSSQVQAGATYWGVMEMSGNVKELCINATGTLDGSTTGAGFYNKAVSGWSSTPAHYGVRGGGFSSADEPLRTSDRSTAMTVSATRDSTVGFRGVGVLNASTLNGGTLTAPVTGCAGESITITGTPVASTVPISYQWYVNVGNGAYELIAGETGQNLTYDGLMNIGSTAVNYSFKRKVFSAIGEGWSNELNVSVTNATIRLSSYIATIDPCRNMVSVTASSVMQGATSNYTWSYNGSPISGVSGATYIPDVNYFDNKAGKYPVVVNASVNGCESVPIDLEVVVDAIPQVFVKCGDKMLDCQGNSYPTVQIGSQCWMQTCLQVGTMVVATNYNTHTMSGIQKMCHNDILSNCAKLGGVYRWEEVVYGENVNLVKYVSKNSMIVQGICPDGWHVPSRDEWLTLVNTAGGSSNALKYNWANGTNSTGFTGIPLALRDVTTGKFHGIGWAHYWTSTSGYMFRLSDTDKVDNYVPGTSWGAAVRCLKN